MAQEIELKLRLPDEAALEALARAVCALGAARAAPVHQVNHFFETPAWDLRRRGIAVRLREEGGRFLLTIKRGAAGPDDGLSVRSEEETEIEGAQARDILAARLSPLDVFAASPDRARLLALAAARAALGGRELRYVGCFENERTRLGPVRLPGETADLPLVFELDRTSFPGGRAELELEVELPRAAEAARARRSLQRLFAQVGVPWAPARSKAERFFERLGANA